MKNNTKGPVPDKILIIQTAFLGDVILTTPLVAAVKKIYPNSIIDFLTIPKSKNILENNPNINMIIIFDKKNQDKGLSGLRRIGNQLNTTEYDVCITPHRSIRSAYLSKATRANIRVGFNRSAWKGAFNKIVAYNPDIHEIERNLSLLEALGHEVEIIRPEIFPTEDDRNNVHEIMTENKIQDEDNIFALAPGSIWPTKRWPEEYFTKICQSISDVGWIPVLIGGPMDQNLCEKIISGCKNAISFAGKLSLRQSTYFLKYCAGLLTNDSAPLHLGLAAGIPVFAIFGSTVPEFGFAPFNDTDVIIEFKDLACRPCGIHGKKKCPIKTFDCMLELKPDMVLNIISKKINLER